MTHDHRRSARSRGEAEEERALRDLLSLDPLSSAKENRRGELGTDLRALHCL